MKVSIIAKCRISDKACDPPIHLEAFRSIYTDSESIKKCEGHTGAERVVCTPELLAWGKIFAFGRDTLEVVRVVLEACCVESGKRHILQNGDPYLTSASSD
jgi:hypothetical protein